MEEVMEVNEIKAVQNLDYHPNVIGILDILLFVLLPNNYIQYLYFWFNF